MLEIELLLLLLLYYIIMEYDVVCLDVNTTTHIKKQLM